MFSVPAIVMATDYCAKSQDSHASNSDPYPCDLVSQMVLSMRSLATAGIYFANRDRRSELIDLRGLCRKVWRRLKADALGCTSVGTGDGYRLQFNSEPEVQDFEPHEYSVAGSSVGSGPLHSIHGIDEDASEEDARMAYQLMEDDDTA